MSNLALVDNFRAAIGLPSMLTEVDGGQGLQADAGCPTPISTGGLTTVPEAAVIHEHPTAECEVKKPCPSLVRSELLTNQVTDCAMFWNVLIPFELNSPWAYKRNRSYWYIRGISSVGRLRTRGPVRWSLRADPHTGSGLSAWR